MQKQLNAKQVFFTAVFVMLILSAFLFLLPDFPYKNIVFIALGGIAAYLGGILSTAIIKDK
ncbi:hypothetical protein [Oceanobacillus manasiensis]|uniref:hypothetical protein n=1 Tax=Oceanobacillus manasiensis TaxID=586413 RepID=UPI0005AB3C79|nr:hypothetical protein [Oceanobacillus manasiensis]